MASLAQRAFQACLLGKGCDHIGHVDLSLNTRVSNIGCRCFFVRELQPVKLPSSPFRPETNKSRSNAHCIVPVVRSGPSVNDLGHG